MTTDIAPPCALGVTSRALSDFRSGGLSAQEMERLQAHTAQCPACQARLDEYETLARTLRAQPEPDSHAQLWRNVRASIAAAPAAPQHQRHIHAGGRPSHAHSTQFWATLGSIAAVVALSVGFVALFVSRGGWPPFGAHVQGTRTIQSGGLTWKQLTLPDGFPGVDQSNESATHAPATVAQSDSETAYACQASQKKLAAARVWATFNAGESWSVITPDGLPRGTGGCRIVIDANDAHTLVVSFYPVLSPSQPAPPDTWITYVSFNGGATWTKPAGLQGGPALMTLTSGTRGKLYATKTDSLPGGRVFSALYVSSDRMQSWTRIDDALPEPPLNLSQVPDTGKTFDMWANTLTSEVLVETNAGTLWSTMDDGAHWTRISYPDGVYISDPHAPELMASADASGGSLRICGLFTDNQIGANQWLACTTDDGKTWSRHDATIILGFSLGAHGDVYGTGPSAGGMDMVIYRLAGSSGTTSMWQRLGAIPGSNYGAGFHIGPGASGHTVFWVFPGVSQTTDQSGARTYTQPNYYVASYP